MKKLILLLVSLFLFFSGFTQITDSVKIVAIDKMGIRDTVVFGFAFGSTSGVDSTFGEHDISSEILRDLDIRLVQRNMVTVDTFWLVGCNSTGYVIPFEQNIDLKKDFRPPNGVLNDHFILGIYATNYPVNREAAIQPFVNAAKVARDAGLDLNAGHDLSLENLRFFKQKIPWIKEVSIGHALISDALYYGLENTIQMYLRELR